MNLSEDLSTSQLTRAYPGLLALLTGKLRDRDVAADLLNDAVCTALDKLRRGEVADPSLLAGFVYRVALNHLRNFRRTDKSGRSSAAALDVLSDPRAHEQSVRDIQSRQWSELVRVVLAELPTDRDRELLSRFYLHDEDRAEICASLELTETHFNRVIFRARERFRELVAQKGLSREDLLALVGWWGLAWTASQLGLPVGELAS